MARTTACTAVGMSVAWVLSPSSDMGPYRVLYLLTSPFMAFPPTYYVLAAVIGLGVGIWLPETRAFVNCAGKRRRY